MFKKIALTTLMALTASMFILPTSQAAGCNSGNGDLNPDTNQQLVADYQTVITDAQGIVVSTDPNGVVPQGGNRWSNNGSWGNVSVGGVIKSSPSGNVYCSDSPTVELQPQKPIINNTPVVPQVQDNPVLVESNITDSKVVEVVQTEDPAIAEWNQMASQALLTIQEFGTYWPTSEIVVAQQPIVQQTAKILQEKALTIKVSKVKKTRKVKHDKHRTIR